MLLFWLLLSTSHYYSAAEPHQQTLRKCCPEHQLLDEFHNCIEHPSYPNIGNLLKASIRNCEKNSSSCQITVVGPGCPLRERSESLVKKLSDHGCLDMATLPNNGPLEGPLMITCNQVKEKSPGFVTKCCPGGQVMSSDLKRCVDHDGLSSRQLLPPRMIREPESALTSGHYQVNYFHRLQLSCDENGSSNEIAVFQHPTYVLTNGTAYFDTGLDYLDGKQYECLDKYIVDEQEDVSQAAIALVCEPMVANEVLQQSNELLKSGPECAQDVELCVPKCCPRNEMFHTDPFR